MAISNLLPRKTMHNLSLIHIYGLLNSTGNRMAFAQDSSYPLLCSLEVLDDEGRLKRKADMFTKRTIMHHEPATNVDTAAEALAVSIGERACVDLQYMAGLMGGPETVSYTHLDGGQLSDYTVRTTGTVNAGAFDVVFQELRTGPEQHNFRITDDNLGVGGQKTKYQNNVAAIRTLKQIEAEGRLATPEEQQTLSLYVGWGSMAQALSLIHSL